MDSSGSTDLPARKSNCGLDSVLNQRQDGILVSLLVLGYNQEQYIRQAVEGALSQTYSPLEIILSDDASDDQTFDIMKAMAADYKGPHKLILNRNPINLDIGGNVNRCIELSSGQLLVKADGDDISRADRVEKLAAKWLEDPKNTYLLYSDCEKIYNDGSFASLEKTFKPLDFVESFIKTDDIVLGAVCAFSRIGVDRFGPLNNIHHEDAVIPFRASALGKISHVPEALVKYRVFAGNTVRNLGRKLSVNRLWYMKHDLAINLHDAVRQLRSKGHIIEQKKLDLRKIVVQPELFDILDARAQDTANQLYLLTGDSLIRKMRIVFKCGWGKPILVKLFVKGVIAKLLNLQLEGSQRP